MKFVNLTFSEKADTCNEEKNLRFWSVLQPEIFYCPYVQYEVVVLNSFAS